MVIQKEAAMTQLSYPGICLEQSRKTMEIFSRITNVLTRIQSEHLPDMSQGNYHYTNQCSAFISHMLG
jgi:hypothetical protein